jgi:hypothetical protein
MSRAQEMIAHAHLGRIRNFVVDFVLVGTAVSYATNIAQAWLLAHELELATLAGILHVLMLPLLLVALVVTRSQRGHAMRQILLWSFMAFYALGFIVPLAVDEHAKTSNAFRCETIGGQLGVGLLTIVVVLRSDPQMFLGLSKGTARAITSCVSFIAGMYLLCLEAALMTISHGDHVYTGPLGISACAIVGYLPVRLYLAVALEGRKWDLVAMAVAFIHLLYRLLT